MTKLRIVFAGTPDPAVPTLRRLVDGHNVVAAITRPDAPLGRRRVLTPSPVAAAAAILGVSVLPTVRFDDRAVANIRALEPDLGVIVAFGALVREPLLSMPRHGWLNLHFSRLPAWRGAAPVQRAIMAGERRLGASVFQLVPELDAGDVYDMLEHEIGPDDTAADALAALARRGAELVAQVVDQIAAGTASTTPQRGTPCYASKLVLDDARIDWTRSDREIHARVRGVTPEPGAFTRLDGAGPSDRFKVHALQLTALVTPLAPGEVAAIDGAIVVGTGTRPVALVTVQPPGKRAMSAAEWWRGRSGERTRFA